MVHPIKKVTYDGYGYGKSTDARTDVVNVTYVYNIGKAKCY